VDEVIRNWLHIKVPEWIQIEDACQVTNVDFRQPGRRVGRRRPEPQQLWDYSLALMEVLKAGYGADLPVGISIYYEEGPRTLAVRLVAVHLDRHGLEPIRSLYLSEGELSQELAHLSERQTEKGNLMAQMVTRVYERVPLEGGGTAPTVFLIKPDEYRFWTRSAGQRDADMISGDVSNWGIALSANTTNGGNRHA
jgi:hypothetical protein